MSQKRNEAAQRIGAIEKLICRDVGRRTQRLIDATAGELRAAAEALAGASSVGLITGFFVPRGDVAAPETDGPVGTALLAAGLAACGVQARIAVDSPCVRAVRAAVAAAGQGGIAMDEIALDDASGDRPDDRDMARRQGGSRDLHRALRPQHRRQATQHAGSRCLALDGAARRSLFPATGRASLSATAATRWAWASSRVR